LSSRACDAATSGDHFLVLLFDDRVADAGVDGGHRGAAVAQNGHDRLAACASLSELGSDGVSESVAGHLRTAGGVNESSLLAGVP
jgi:hypothetical protein